MFSHTCSNTEIVCALGASATLVGVDADSDFPPEIVAPLPKPGRDLDLDVREVIALKPDLVLSSLTVPGHERIVDELRAAGLRTEVIDPLSLEDIYASIRRIAQLLGVESRGDALVEHMQAAMPRVMPSPDAPRILVEWWPKPVIAPGRQSWVTDLIELAGGINPWGARPVKSGEISAADAHETPPDAIVMSWCGVKLENYRADVVLRREGWADVRAIREQRVVPVTEAFLGRPGPRVAEGYKALRAIIEEIRQADLA